MLEKLKARLKVLETECQQTQNILNQAIANLQRKSGAIEEIGRLIHEIEKEANKAVNAE